MVHDQLVLRRAVAIQTIGELLGVSFEGLPKAIDSEHNQLFTLERIAEILKSQSGMVTELKEEDGEPVYTLNEILAIDGLSKTSQKAIQAALDGSSD